jgi:hypothetical protein
MAEDVPLKKQARATVRPQAAGKGLDGDERSAASREVVCHRCFSVFLMRNGIIRQRYDE